MSLWTNLGIICSGKDFFLTITYFSCSSHFKNQMTNCNVIETYVSVFVNLVSETGACESNPCDHGGSCVEVAYGYTCDCAGTGFTGSNCQGAEQFI